jgi:hypothetical protein
MNLSNFSAMFSCTLVLFVCGSATFSAGASRDWTKYPPIVQLDTSEDVFAIGDPHADPERLLKVLAAAHLIDASVPNIVKWSGGKSVLVITGDLIDKGPNSIAVIMLLRRLESDAADHGGRVIITMGNHEAEFLAQLCGDTSKQNKTNRSCKTNEFSKELQDWGSNPKEVASCIDDIGQFLCGLPIAARVNDWFFSHAGNTQSRTIQQLTADIEDGFFKKEFKTEELIGNDSILEARLNNKGPKSMPWFQGGKSSTDPQVLLKQYADHLGVNHLVQGHQYESVKFSDGKNRKRGYFFQRYGLLFLIDTGMSQDLFMDSHSTGGALRITGPIEKQEATVICSNLTQKTLWNQKKTDREETLCNK